MSYLALQNELVARGGDPGPLDGEWGFKTQHAYQLAATVEAQKEVDALNLADVARGPALILRLRHPSVRFTSGRRSVRDQARAMSQNVVKNRRWIAETYAATPESQRLQLWVSNHPSATAAAEIEEGLYGVMAGWSDDQLARLSSHLSGRAFDVQPVSGATGEAIKATLYKLTAGVGKFLEKEGGLVRWHAQFRA